MNTSFENEDDNFLEFIKPHDLHLKIDLSASAPIGYPHIIDVSSLAEEGISETNLIFLDLVDTVASVLYKWDPIALRDLLDLSTEVFYWDHKSDQGWKHYVRRVQRTVEIGSTGPNRKSNGLRVDYTIHETGRWCGGSWFCATDIRKVDDSTIRAIDLAQAELATQLIVNRMWIGDPKESFVYEINGNDMIGKGKQSIVATKSQKQRQATAPPQKQRSPSPSPSSSSDATSEITPIPISSRKRSAPTDSRFQKDNSKRPKTRDELVEVKNGIDLLCKAVGYL